MIGSSKCKKMVCKVPKSIKNTLKFIFHLWKTVTRWRCSRKIWENILKTAISPLLKCFQRWYGYQNMRDSSSTVHAWSFALKLDYYLVKYKKTSKKNMRFLACFNPNQDKLFGPLRNWGGEESRRSSFWVVKASFFIQMKAGIFIHP